MKLNLFAHRALVIDDNKNNKEDNKNIENEENNMKTNFRNLDSKICRLMGIDKDTQTQYEKKGLPQNLTDKYLDIKSNLNSHLFIVKNFCVYELKDVRKSFGYKTYESLADACGVAAASINRIEIGNIAGTSASMCALYYFFVSSYDEKTGKYRYKHSNKKDYKEPLAKPVVGSNGKVHKIGPSYKRIHNYNDYVAPEVLNDPVYMWIENNLKSAIVASDYNRRGLADHLGMDTSNICNMCNHLHRDFKSVTPVMKKVYSFFNPSDKSDAAKEFDNLLLTKRAEVGLNPDGSTPFAETDATSERGAKLLNDLLIEGTKEHQADAVSYLYKLVLNHEDELWNDLYTDRDISKFDEARSELDSLANAKKYLEDIIGVSDEA